MCAVGVGRGEMGEAGDREGERGFGGWAMVWVVVVVV